MAFAVYPHTWHLNLLCDRRFFSLYDHSTRNAGLCTLAEQQHLTTTPELLVRKLAAYFIPA